MTNINITPNAPNSSAYVTVGNDGTLTSERSLTGTANQVVVTDNGAGSTIVLSTPQDIATSSDVTFGQVSVTDGLKTGDHPNNPTEGDVHVKRTGNSFGIIYMENLNSAYVGGTTFGDNRILTGGAYQFFVTANSNIVCGATAALATNATNGFLYIPTMAGTPTGTPTAYTGKVAMVFDTTGNKLWIYDGAWIGVALA